MGSAPLTRRVTPYADLGIGCLLALALLILAVWNVPGAGLLRFLCGMAVGLVVPGYSLVSALFPRKSDVDGAERAGLSLVLSAVLVILVAWLLSAAGVRLDTRNIAASLAGLSVFLAALAAWRRSRMPAEAVFLLDLPRGRVPYAVLGLAALLALLTWATVSANLSAATPAFSLLGSHGRLSGYPFHVTVGAFYPLTVQVTNPTGETLSYLLDIRDNHGYVRDTSIMVPARGRWAETVALPSAAPPRTEAVRFRLEQRGMVKRELWVRYRIVT